MITYWKNKNPLQSEFGRVWLNFSLLEENAKSLQLQYRSEKAESLSLGVMLRTAAVSARIQLNLCCLTHAQLFEFEVWTSHSVSSVKCQIRALSIPVFLQHLMCPSQAMRKGYWHLGDDHNLVLYAEMQMVWYKNRPRFRTCWSWGTAVDQPCPFDIYP